MPAPRPCELATAQVSAFPRTTAPRSRRLPAATPASPPGSRTSPTRSLCCSKVDPVAHRPSTCTGRGARAPAITSYRLHPATTPNLRHQASGGGTVTITSSVAILNDTTWSTIVGTWRPGRLELYLDGWSRASSTAAATNTSALFGIYRCGWGFSTSQDFNGDIALIACFASSWTPAMVRRWHADPFGFLRPWNEVPALMGSAPPATPPSTGTGVVTFLMG